MNIVIFYHAIFSGGSRPIDTPCACQIMQEQMSALKKSGLENAAQELYIGINGPRDDINVARLFAPQKAQFLCHGPSATTEITTMNCIRQWASKHDSWYVMYHHMKGVTHPPLDINWRRRMEKFVVWEWKQCVNDLQRGYDICGCHWLTAKDYPGGVKTPFFGGTFWWATAKYLTNLPPLPPATWENRYEAEAWIGKSRKKPRVMDYFPGWPTN